MLKTSACFLQDEGQKTFILGIISAVLSAFWYSVRMLGEVFGASFLPCFLPLVDLSDCSWFLEQCAYQVYCSINPDMKNLLYDRILIQYIGISFAVLLFFCCLSLQQSK